MFLCKLHKKGPPVMGITPVITFQEINKKSKQVKSRKGKRGEGKKREEKRRGEKKNIRGEFMNFFRLNVTSGKRWISAVVRLSS